MHKNYLVFTTTTNKGGDAFILKDVNITVNDKMKVLPSSILSAVTVTVLFCTVVTTTAAPAEDEVTSYPDFGPPPTPHYSGYLDVSDACDTKKNGPDCQLHYMLALAEVDDAAADDVDASSDDEVTTPTVVWFNGGPGCSSLQGFFLESGPFTMTAKGGIMSNPYSWTHAGVNFLALESPMGVGFSYCSNSIEKNATCFADDQSTAKMNKAALIDFFNNKFPELEGGDFYVAGESYAGVYIPTLTKELLDDPLAKDPTGILVGNPVMCDDAYNLVQTQISPSIIEPDIFIVISDIDESYKFGFMAPDTYHTLTSDECSDAFEMMNDDDDDDGDDDDDNQMNYFYNNDDGRMDDDQQQQDPERSKKTRAGTRLPSKTRKLFQMLHKKRNKDGVGTRLPLGNRNKLQRMLRKRRQTKQKETRAIGFNPVVKKCLSAFYEGSFGSAAYMYADGIDPYGVYNPWLGDGLVPASPLDEYLSQDTVQTALHVEVADVTTFHSCGGGRVSYTKQYACNGPDSEFPDISMINFYQEIAPKLKKTWIISGDTDTVIPMEGTRDAVQAIGFPIIKNQSYRGWYYNGTAASIDFLAEKGQQFGANLVASQLELAQFGGDVVNYEEGLSFVTVHGAGHLVGQDRPQQSLHMFKKFIKKDEELSMLSPPLPFIENFDDPMESILNSTLDWYKTAQSPPFVQP